MRKKNDTVSAREGGAGGASSARLLKTPPKVAPHSHERMRVTKVYDRGTLSSHTVEFNHTCGLDESFSWTQESLPW